MKLAEAAINFDELFREQQEGWVERKITLDSGTSFGDIITAILPYVFTAAGIGLLIFLIFGGISMMLSRGDPKALEAAKAKITGALTGFIILFVSYWIVQIIGQVLGLTAIQDIFK